MHIQKITREKFQYVIKTGKKLRNIQINIESHSYTDEQQRMADLIANMIRRHFLSYTLEIRGVVI